MNDEVELAMQHALALDTITTLRAQRDELLAALRSIAASNEIDIHAPATVASLRRIASAAIAKVQA